MKPFYGRCCCGGWASAVPSPDGSLVASCDQGCDTEAIVTACRALADRLLADPEPVNAMFAFAERVLLAVAQRPLTRPATSSDPTHTTRRPNV